MNKAQWKRNEDGGLELYVFEPSEEGLGAWKIYTQSKVYTKDLCNFKGASRGLDTFRNCLKNNYTILDVEGKEI